MFVWTVFDLFEPNGGKKKERRTFNSTRPVSFAAGKGSWMKNAARKVRVRNAASSCSGTPKPTITPCGFDAWDSFPNMIFVVEKWWEERVPGYDFIIVVKDLIG